MKKFKFPLIALGLVCVLFAIFYALTSEKTLVMNPKGLLARRELSLIHTNLLLMMIIMVPTWLWLFWTAWKYRADNPKAHFDPNHKPGWLGQTLQWGIPTVIIAIMAVVNWNEIKELDPYRPLASEEETLNIQVVALNWKWLFIYPEQQIASLNFVQFPVHRPVKFSLTADGSPMNSFWIPQLSGQIYSMTGMVTPLHIVAEEIGEYLGKAAEINGKGYASMTFTAKATSQSDFDAWVKAVKQSSLKLTDKAYNQLVEPSTDMPVRLYADVAENLFDDIVMKPMHPH